MAHPRIDARVDQDLPGNRRPATIADPVERLSWALEFHGNRSLAEKFLAQSGVAWGPALAAALLPLTTAITIAILALVAYDGVLTRVEKLAGARHAAMAEVCKAIERASEAYGRYLAATEQMLGKFPEGCSRPAGSARCQ